jgi:hypothetical protein
MIGHPIAYSQVASFGIDQYVPGYRSSYHLLFVGFTRYTAITGITRSHGSTSLPEEYNTWVRDPAFLSFFPARKLSMPFLFFFFSAHELLTPPSLLFFPLL